MTLRVVTARTQATDSFAKDLIDNACYAVKPPERAVVRQVCAVCGVLCVASSGVRLCWCSV